MTAAFKVTSSGAVGKLPTLAEYLPVPAEAPSFAAFDTWLTEALEWAAARAGAAWQAAFSEGAMYGFTFRSPAASPGGLLCGALTPSHDSAGRQFPLALAAALQLDAALLKRPELLPFVLEGVWLEATQGLSDLRQAEAGAGGPPTAELGAAAELDCDEAAQLYEGWAESLPLQELWQLLGTALADPPGTFRLLFETLAPVRGVERPDTTLCLRLPLGAAGGAALCFWLDIVRRFLGWRATAPSLFWSHDGTDGMALLLVGAPPKDALAELWLPVGAREQIADFTRPPSAATLTACRPLPPSLQALVQSPAATVATLLAALVG